MKQKDFTMYSPQLHIKVTANKKSRKTLSQPSDLPYLHFINVCNKLFAKEIHICKFNQNVILKLLIQFTATCTLALERLEMYSWDAKFSIRLNTGYKHFSKRFSFESKNKI